MILSDVQQAEDRADEFVVGPVNVLDDEEKGLTARSTMNQRSYDVVTQGSSSRIRHRLDESALLVRQLGVRQLEKKRLSSGIEPEFGKGFGDRGGARRT